MHDALSLVPALGLVLFSVPLIWGGSEITTAQAMVFLFLSWAGLSALCGVLSWFLPRRRRKEPPGP
ncbi:hypothetical protein [Poseidonocella pacifica]|uniref:hypothetical protein n=1 Tax=Poseidonocella pacifica TaxID=871651 RepID=UPI001113B92B|nr:hypothetical protein [Poseidonocella pacifica]